MSFTICPSAQSKAQDVLDTGAHRAYICASHRHSEHIPRIHQAHQPHHMGQRQKEKETHDLHLQLMSTADAVKGGSASPLRLLLYHHSGYAHAELASPPASTTFSNPAQLCVIQGAHALVHKPPQPSQPSTTPHTLPYIVQSSTLVSQLRQVKVGFQGHKAVWGAHGIQER